MWKFSTSVLLTSPVDLVSTRVACQIVLSASEIVASVAVPARVLVEDAVGAVRTSVARCIRVMVRRRLASPTAGPR